jgi:hypothetical protein
MSANDVGAAGVGPGSDGGQGLAQRLERGEVIYEPVPPFALPAGPDLAFLLQQELGSLAHKNISYNPRTGQVAGFVRKASGQAEQLRRIFLDFSAAVTAWLGAVLPLYRSGWDLDRCSFRPQEEATRRLRLTARNDLLHVDAFPGRPSRGRRILRVFANINPHEPRIWVTSDPFARLLERFGPQAGLPATADGGWLRNLGRGLIGLFHPKQARRSAYDAFMLRFHDYLKANEEFQERGPKRLWTFPPNSVWLAMTDTCSHAVLRGRFALEHSYFIGPQVQALPAESPPALLGAACRAAGPRRAA